MDGGLLFVFVIVLALTLTCFFFALRPARPENEVKPPAKPVTAVGVFWAVILAILALSAFGAFVNYCFK
jgi:heme/copper-type cytochrome/quinol oxidase subunit 2